MFCLPPSAVALNFLLHGRAEGIEWAKLVIGYLAAILPVPYAVGFAFGVLKDGKIADGAGRRVESRSDGWHP